MYRIVFSVRPTDFVGVFQFENGGLQRHKAGRISRKSSYKSASGGGNQEGKQPNPSAVGLDKAMLLLVNLDLKGPANTHAAPIEAIKRQGEWWHYMRATWIVNTYKSPNDLVNEIAPLLQPNDLLLVSPLTIPYQGRLQQDAWEWINSRYQAASL
jgi:hypothetical protein